MSQEQERERRREARGPATARLLVLLATTLAGIGVVSGLSAQETGEPGITAATVTFSAPAAGVEIELEDGTRRALELRAGSILADGSEVGTYPEDGELASEWREVLRSNMDLPPEELAASLREWSPDPDLAGAGALTDALDRMLPVEAAPVEDEVLPEDRDTATDTDTAGSPEETGDTAELRTVTGPGGAPLTIAPGGLSISDLNEQIERLKNLLSRVGEEARAAAEDITFIVHDDYTIAEGRTVSGNLALVDGELRLLGEIDGDALVLDGALLLESASRVLGDVLAVGGEVRRLGGRVDGEIVSIRQSEAVPEAAPEERRVRPERTPVRHEGRGPIESLLDNIGDAISGVFAVIVFLLVLALLGMLLSSMAGDRLRIVADTTRASFGRSFLVGILAQILILPVAAMIAAGVITAPLLILYFPMVAVAILAGYLASGQATGELLDRKRYAWLDRFRRPGHLYQLVLGVALLLLPFALAQALELFGRQLSGLRGLLIFAGFLVTWLAASTGLGAIVLSYAGDRRNYAGPPTGPAGPPGGPPPGGAPPPGGPAPAESGAAVAPERTPPEPRGSAGAEPGAEAPPPSPPPGEETGKGEGGA